MSIPFLTVHEEILELRKIISSTQNSVLFNLCSIEKITNNAIEFGHSVVKLKVLSGKTNQKFSLSNFSNLKMILGEPKQFYFNHIFNGDGEKLSCMLAILNVFLSGENACIMVHGETGS